MCPKSIPPAAFLLSELCSVRSWKEALWVLSAHSSQKLPWEKVAPAMPPQPLLQTNKADLEGSQDNIARFAGGHVLGLYLG